MRDGPDNPAKPAAGMRLCAVDEIADPGSKGFRFRAEARLFAGFVVRQGEAVRGFVDQCPHAGWPLGYDDRYLTRGGDHILCAGHGALFTLDGEGVTVPCLGQRLTAWPVEVREGEVFTT
ncbi:Rieske (2Fe-2S) protein [Phenylobacterium sp.]|uniref:Rieske (2Fe-2S) protein n=1 Tax=Phenylobacterium sp. TaxID=1871053 RepID=UPI002F3F90D5